MNGQYHRCVIAFLSVTVILFSSAWVTRASNAPEAAIADDDMVQQLQQFEQRVAALEAKQDDLVKQNERMQKHLQTLPTRPSPILRSIPHIGSLLQRRPTPRMDHKINGWRYTIVPLNEAVGRRQ